MARTEQERKRWLSWYSKNREHRINYMRHWRIENRAKMQEYGRKYRQKKKVANEQKD